MLRRDERPGSTSPCNLAARRRCDPHAAARVGPEYEQFSNTGVLQVRSNYSDDQLHGKYESFFVSGKSKAGGSYYKGKKHGLWREFAADGDKVRFATYRFVPGQRYFAEVSLDSGKSIAYRYLVEFCAAVSN